ncbi:MAG TPA: hypothetical protein VH000_11645 [Rhizomicrobium sp.]|jgi:hypothetical protein|nr:hypothetical protein [Rhizomicrobium sp.]
MSRIVLGLATSHSPLLTFGVDTWSERSGDDMKRRLNLSDGRMISYDDLKAERGEPFVTQSSRDHLEAQSDACQQSLDRLADTLEKVSPDLVVVVGDDQAELFSLANMPAISIFYGEKILTHPWGEVDGNMPNWKRKAAVGYGMDRVHHYQGAPEAALSAIKGLIERGVDIAGASDVADPHKAGFGHAYGFIAERLFRGKQYPILPVLLNTYFKPNVPTSARCYDIGSKLREVLEATGDLRIAVVASGGLSHFVTDEALDRGVLDAIRAGDADHLRSVPPEALRSGSSEILNWILAAGAAEKLTVDWSNYLPIYRTPAGSGIGLGFMSWQ